MLITLSALTTLLAINWRLDFDCKLWWEQIGLDSEAFKMREDLENKKY